jgi:hypothetical protein
MSKPFKHTVSSLKKFNKALARRVKKQEKVYEKMSQLAASNRTLLDDSAKLTNLIDNFDPYNPS